MSGDEMLEILVAVLGANALTLLFLRGLWEITRAEKFERETGQKHTLPPYVYLFTAVPLIIMAGGAYYLKIA